MLSIIIRNLDSVRDALTLGIHSVVVEERLFIKSGKLIFYEYNYA